MWKFSFCFVSLMSLAAGVYIAKGNCPTNEEFQLCGSACPRNCSDPGPANCTDDCVEGCFCMTGYLRDENGTCVPADSCAAGKLSCGDNEEFLPCGSACPATCAAPEPEVCGLACSVGCFCREGFYRDEATQQCVTMDNCSTADMCFNANEVYDVCSAACEPSCAEPEPTCAKLCRAGCVCAPGLLRGAAGDCVSVERCPAANGTRPDVLSKYLTTINKILHLTAV